MSLISFLLENTQRACPLTTLTNLSAKITDVPLGKFTQFLIKQFINTYNINLNECLESDISKYKTFNEFFIRKLKPEARIQSSSDINSPVDGTVAQLGDISYGRLIQAKGIDYSLVELVGTNEDGKVYDDGKFICIYLSPANYHRIHMPCDGRLVKTIHIPGKHFPVGKKNISHLKNLYTKNERLTCIFDTKFGKMSVIMVGAALVGSINTVWEGNIKRKEGLKISDYEQQNLVYKKGDEIGHFKFGSTVIVLFEKDKVNFNINYETNSSIKFGASLIN